MRAIRWKNVMAGRNGIIAAFALGGILLHLIMRFGWKADPALFQLPLLATLLFGGLPLIYGLAKKLWKREFGADLLAGISIITSILLHEYLAGSIVVLMLSGGEALEAYAIQNASSALRALARRMPAIAHKRSSANIVDVALESISVGDLLVIYPHEVCPADGTVREGHGVMDESYLTGEPFKITKTVGSAVISGAVNGDAALVIEATKRPADSRYAKIMEVMRKSEQEKPRIRRLGDQLGAIYTPVALCVALAAWFITGEAIRFLAVLVIATPCPLLLAIPIAIIGSISLSARRAIVIKNASALEQITQCRTAIFDKTGTLTYGEPKISQCVIAGNFTEREILTFSASLERYSKHPLAVAILDAAKQKGVPLLEADFVSEPPGKGLDGQVGGHRVELTGRRHLLAQKIAGYEKIPSEEEGLECMLVIDGHYAAMLRFRDAPRKDSRLFVKHLRPQHHLSRIIIVSGDRESEVRYLADQIGIEEIYASRTPEEKVAIVHRETAAEKTLYVGDGINDAPAMVVATVAIAIGQSSDVAAKAADVVIMDNSLKKVDEFLHIGRQMRAIALQSAVGGMLLSIIGMAFAAGGYLNPVGGAICQEVIDVIAVLNALRAAWPPKVISDF